MTVEQLQQHLTKLMNRGFGDVLVEALTGQGDWAEVESAEVHRGANNLTVHLQPWPEA